MGRAGEKNQKLWQNKARGRLQAYPARPRAVLLAKSRAGLYRRLVSCCGRCPVGASCGCRRVVRARGACLGRLVEPATVWLDEGVIWREGGGLLL